MLIRKFENKSINFIKSLFTGKMIPVIFVISVVLSSAITYAVIEIPHNFTDGTVISAGEMNANFLAIKNNIDSVQSELIGMVMPFTGDSSKVPNGWIVCDGSEVSRTEYAVLFDRIGTTWGSGNGATTFNLPDLRGVFLRGLDLGRGKDPARSLGSYQEDSFQTHAHRYQTSNGGCSGTGWYAMYGDLWDQGCPLNTSSVTSGRVADETRPMNVAVIYIVKAK